MKFRLVVTDARGEEWFEDEDRGNIHSIEEAKVWAKETIAMFNRTLRPHEIERTVVRVEELKEVTESMAEASSHDWEKTNLVTIINEYFGSHDTVKCRICGITGKRFGLGLNVARDREFKAPGYGRCDNAVKLLERRAARREKAKKAEGKDGECIR